MKYDAPSLHPVRNYVDKDRQMNSIMAETLQGQTTSANGILSTTKCVLIPRAGWTFAGIAGGIFLQSLLEWRCGHQIAATPAPGLKTEGASSRPFLLPGRPVYVRASSTS